jgi:hypothetical protein
MGPIWAKLLEHLTQNGRAIRDAPLVFVAVLIIAFGLAFWVSGLRYEGVLAQKDGTIERLKVQVSVLQDRIMNLEQQLTSRPQAQSPSAAPTRDPDGIYQFGVQVGSVTSPQVDESRGMVWFGTIIAAVKFNQNNNFEYRDFILHVKSIATETGASSAGQAVGRALNQVTCEIVGRVPNQ